MLRVLTAMTAACLAAAVGQILVRRGMQQVGPLSTWAPLPLAAYFWRALTNPYVIAGTVGNALFYFLFLAVLSWANVTVALPLTALEYAFAAALSVAILKEAVPPLRWAGIALVIVGVALIGVGPAETSRAGQTSAPKPSQETQQETRHENTIRHGLS
jgi:drug/metabolite transporter (DMT)-like permease